MVVVVEMNDVVLSDDVLFSDFRWDGKSIVPRNSGDKRWGRIGWRWVDGRERVVIVLRCHENDFIMVS